MLIDIWTVSPVAAVVLAVLLGYLRAADFSCCWSMTYAKYYKAMDRTSSSTITGPRRCGTSDVPNDASA
jgi:hypothetical protein